MNDPLAPAPPGRHSDRLGAVLVVALPIAVYGAVILAYYRRLRSTLALPDYGDLWRMSVRYSADGRFDLGEPFVEAQPLAHIPVVHASLNHLAITRSDYTIFWIVGALAAVGIAWIVGGGLLALLPQSERRTVTVIGAALAGLLAFRFDVRNMVTNSLLLESHVLFLQGIVAIALASRLAVVRHGHRGGVPRSWSTVGSDERVLVGALLGMLIVGDAPTGILSISMIAVGLVAPVVARSPVNSTFRLLGVLGLAAISVRWLTLRLLDARGSTHSGAEPNVIEVFLDTLRLIGAGLVNQTAVFTATQETYDRVHILVAVALLTLWGITILRLLRRRDPSRQEVALTVGLTLAVASIAASSTAIALLRDVANNHQASRAVRATTLAAPATVAALYYNLRSIDRVGSRAPVAVLSVAACLLGLRVIALGNSYEHVDDVLRFRERTALIVCEQPRAEERWDLLWPGFNEASINEALTSRHLDIVDRAGCGGLAGAGPDR